MYVKEGVAGFFTGMGPRALRAAPACGIIIASYELLKATLVAGSKD